MEETQLHSVSNGESRWFFRFLRHGLLVWELALLLWTSACTNNPYKKMDNPYDSDIELVWESLNKSIAAYKQHAKAYNYLLDQKITPQNSALYNEVLRQEYDQMLEYQAKIRDEAREYATTDKSWIQLWDKVDPDAYDGLITDRWTD